MNVPTQQLAQSPPIQHRSRGSRPRRDADELPLRDAAVIAGLGLLIMAVLSFLATSVLGNLINNDDAVSTARDLADHQLLFRAGALSLVTVAGLDVLVAWALRLLLRPAHAGLAVLAAWLRVAYATAFIACLANLFVAARTAAASSQVDGFTSAQRQSQVLLLTNTFQDGWEAALLIFGVHLLVVGYLVIKTTYMPAAIGVLVAVAGAGYLADSLGRLTSTDYSVHVSAVTFIGEVALMVWLLWKGRRLDDPATGVPLASTKTLLSEANPQ